MYRACEICEYFARHGEAEAGDCRRRAPVPVRGPAQEDHDASLKAWQQYARQRARRRQLKDELLALQQEEIKNPAPEPNDFNGHTPESLREHITELRRTLKDAKASLATLQATGLSACPTCGTPVCNLTEHIAKQKQHVETIPADIAATEAVLTEIEEHRLLVRQVAGGTGG